MSLHLVLRWTIFSCLLISPPCLCPNVILLERHWGLGSQRRNIGEIQINPQYYRSPLPSITHYIKAFNNPTDSISHVFPYHCWYPRLGSSFCLLVVFFFLCSLLLSQAPQLFLQMQTQRAPSEASVAFNNPQWWPRWSVQTKNSWAQVLSPCRRGCSLLGPHCFTALLVWLNSQTDCSTALIPSEETGFLLSPELQACFSLAWNPSALVLFPSCSSHCKTLNWARHQDWGCGLFLLHSISSVPAIKQQPSPPYIHFLH